ncbi:WavE lipopolysaccharide synthesis family protein [Brachyspira intermedia]|uniref:WavE lipopolysaccharide synthesis family protein n=1 Tax=Brachyspira intermedia TaxID=84377 RepID=UPI00300431C3
MKINNINTKDISVVVQGAIDKEYTHRCLKSIRKYLPKSEIILSTWKNSNVDRLDYDILVLSEDPGGSIFDFNKSVINNTNRQLISVQNGLKKVNNKYILKFRSDNILIDNKFLNYFDRFNSYNDRYKIFQSRFLVSCIYSREYGEFNKFPTPFHPSDFFIFGYSSDIKKYFDKTELLKNESLSDFNCKYHNKIPYINNTYQYTPEQYLCYSWAKRYFEDIVFDDWSDWNDKNIEQSNNILYNNFVFLNPYQSCFINYKHLWALELYHSINGLITYKVFQNYYKKLCDNNYVIEMDFRDQIDNLKFYQKLFRIIKYYNKLIIFIFGIRITIKLY